jgi:hypothetical protein
METGFQNFRTKHVNGRCMTTLLVEPAGGKTASSSSQVEINSWSLASHFNDYQELRPGPFLNAVSFMHICNRFVLIDVHVRLVGAISVICGGKNWPNLDEGFGLVVE